MVNESGSDGERALALSYAPVQARAGLAALLALDDTLAGLVRAHRDPLVAEMRLTWWFEALGALDERAPPAQPVLEALASDVLPAGVRGATLAASVDGWEALLDPAPLDTGRLTAYAEGRGGVLFAAAARVLGAKAGDPVAAAGRGWALVDLVGRLSDAAEVDAARAAADAALKQAFGPRWSRAGRALGALALSARMDLEGSRPNGAPRRVGRLLRFRLTGR